MADTPSSILLLRLQSTGSNTNLWGGYLNAALQTIERASKGYQAYAVTGDATLSWTNYSATNDGAVATLKLTGSLTSAATLTMPAYQNFVLVWNTAAQAVTIKCSGGVGVAVSNGDKALIYCDGVDYYNAAPSLFNGAITIAGQLHGMATGSASTDGVNVAQLAAAIAASVPAGTAGTFLNSITDTTRGFLTDKLAFLNTGLLIATMVTQNSGANENSLISIDDRRLRRRLYFMGQV